MANKSNMQLEKRFPIAKYQGLLMITIDFTKSNAENLTKRATTSDTWQGQTICLILLENIISFFVTF